MPFQGQSKSHEINHVLREELEFRAMARRNKLLGLWLAGIFGLSDADAQAYARLVVQADMDEPGDEDVIRAVMADIARRGAAITEAEVRAKLAELLPAARWQIQEEAGG